MPGRVFLTAPMAEVAAALEADPAPVSGEPPRLNIAPGDQVVARAAGGLMRMRWGIVPVGRVNARGRPVMETIVNARCETLFDKTAFAGTGRAVMPVSGWYEWTGARRRKTAWRIAPRGGGLLFFAAICDVWQAPGGAALHQIATVTCAPSADVEAVHHRMAVILAPCDVPAWLTAPPAEAARLLRPWPDGRLQVEPAPEMESGHRT